jgi:hypothetical protein
MKGAFLRPVLAFTCALVARILTVTQTNEIVVRYCLEIRANLLYEVEEERQRAREPPRYREAPKKAYKGSGGAGFSIG